MQDAEELRQLTAQFLAIEWPDGEVDEWVPRACGELPDFFPLDGYDALLLDHDLGLGNGLEWLVRLAQRKDAPPIVLLIDSGEEDSARKAVRYGAFLALPKQDLTRARLVDAVKSAAARRSARRVTGAKPRPMRGSPPLHENSRTQPADDAMRKPHEVEISGYRMLERIGTGGMATVYLAERNSDGLQLVMKIMNARLTEENEFLKRFIQEYGLVSRIECPQVVRIYDQGVTDQHVYIAMEYFSGGDLRARIRQRVAPNHALDILRNVALGLSAVHAHGIVHRDLKPDNVMFRSDETLAIVDFGIATIQLGGVDLTDRGDVLGTPHYLSPEQARGRPLDGRSDLYSLGIVFFEMLTGRRPFKAKDAVGLAQKHVNQPLPRLPAELARYQELMDCLTAKRVEDRFATAGELIEYLESNTATLRVPERSAVLTANAGEETSASDEDEDPRRSSRSPARKSPVKTHSSPHRSGAEPRGDTNESALDARATLTHLGGDPGRLEELKLSFVRTAQALLIVIADAIDDGNFPFIYHAALMLQDTLTRVEAPALSSSVSEIAKHASQRDIEAVTAAYGTTHALMRRVMTELARLVAD